MNNHIVASETIESAAKSNKKVPVIPADVFTGENSKLTPDEAFAIFINKNVFIPTWENKPVELKPVLTLNGISFLTSENTSSIIAPPGIGKSSICEATCAAFINSSCDSLGIEVSSDCEGVVYIDNERTTTDVWNSFYRMARRAGIKGGEKIENVTIAGLRAVPRLKERLKVIEHLIKDNPCSLLIIDGAGDLVTDTNDLMQAIECRIWLREVTSKNKISILTTLHPNPKDYKPRGHIGSEVHRESECVLLARSYENDVRILTSDFEFGKNRNNDKISTGFKWSEDQHMFVTVELDTIPIIKQDNTETLNRRRAEQLALKVLPPQTALSHTDLCEAIKRIEDCSLSTQKRRIDSMVEYKFIEKHQDGLYRFVM